MVDLEEMLKITKEADKTKWGASRTNKFRHKDSKQNWPRICADERG